MIYLKFKQISKTRYELEEKSGEYEPLTTPNRRGKIKIGLSDYIYVTHTEKQAPYYLSHNNKHITGLFYGDISNPDFAYGDYKNDCLIFHTNFEIGDIEILVFPNRKPFKIQLFNDYLNTNFYEEIQNRETGKRPQGL